MEVIAKYRAADGREFSEAQKCVEYEALCERVAVIMSALPPKPDLPACRFENGGGYIQHNPATLAAVRDALLDVINEKIPHRWIRETKADPAIHPSWVGRIVGEYNIKPLNDAWFRFSCIDGQHREWGQPFYANNPDEGTQVELDTA